MSSSANLSSGPGKGAPTDKADDGAYGGGQPAAPDAKSRKEPYTSRFLYTYTKTFKRSQTQSDSMSEVVSFRPDDDERSLIETTRRSLGLGTRAEAVRWLVREGGKRAVNFADSPVFRFRVPARYRRKRSVTSREIDDVVYGDP